jgi:hypothetical protein
MREELSRANLGKSNLYLASAPTDAFWNNPQCLGEPGALDRDRHFRRRRGAWVALAVLGRADRRRRHRWADRPLAARGIGARSKKTADPTARPQDFRLLCTRMRKNAEGRAGEHSTDLRRSLGSFQRTT